MKMRSTRLGVLGLHANRYAPLVAIMVLLAFLITMNALAVILRKRFERRW